MSAYGQFCPVAKAAEVFAERWTPLVIRELLCGSHRFNELRRGVPLMSPTLLSQRLKTLEMAGIVECRRSESGVTEYHLTPAGEEFRPVVEMLGMWGQRWAKKDVRPEDRDPALLVWDIHRRLNVDAFPDKRPVVGFHFPDAVKEKRYRWLVVNDGNVDVCLADPGYGVDLVVRSSVRAMVDVWMGDRPLSDALRSGAIVLEGPAKLRRAFPSWLQLSLFAPVARPPARAF